MRKYLITVLLVLSASAAQSQVLISLLLGDKLNSDKIEFGMDGGVNFANMSNLENSKSESFFNLGFYFDLKLKNQFMIHTGVIVKSTMGATRIDTYPLDNVSLDTLFDDGYITRKIQYFNVPVLLKYRFATYYHVEAGPMFGLRTKAKDVFTNSIHEDDDLKHNVDIKDQFTRLDAGIMVGAGIKLSKVPKSSQISIRYYYGFVDARKDNNGDPQHHSSLYLCFSLPIGVAKEVKTE